MYVGTGGDVRKHDFAERQSESIAHGINEDIRNKEREGVVSNNKRPQTLAEESKVRPLRAFNIVSGRKVEEEDAGRIQIYIK